MAFWDDVYNAIVTAVEAVAEVIETVVNVVAEVIADVVETVGNAIQDGLNALGGGPTNGPGGAFCAWLGGVIAGATNLLAVGVKALFNMNAGIVAGVIRLVAGIVLVNGRLFSKGIAGIVSAIAGMVITEVGAALSFIQAVIHVQNDGRPLTNEEKTILNNVFRRSLNLYNIRIIERRQGIFGITNSTFTLNNTIYFRTTVAKQGFATLIHECVHVWQYQNLGTQYISNAIGAQLIYGRVSGVHDAYDWTDELTRGNTDWNDFNGEAQAALIEEIWDKGTVSVNGYKSTVEGVYYSVDTLMNKVEEKGGNVTHNFVSKLDMKDHTTLADTSIVSLRRFLNLRISSSFYP